eukprot:gene36450-44217_t
MAESESDEEFGDIAWEDAEQPNDSSGATNAGAIEVSLDGPAPSEKRKRNAARKRLKEDDYQAALDYTHAYISSRLDHVVRLALVSDDPDLAAMLQSLLPLQLHQPPAPQPSSSSSMPHQNPTLLHAKSLFSWLSAEFKAIPSVDVTVEEGRDGFPYPTASPSFPNSPLPCGIEQALASRGASVTCLHQLLYALLVCMHVSCRLVAGIDVEVADPRKGMDEAPLPPLITWVEVFGAAGEEATVFSLEGRGGREGVEKACKRKNLVVAGLEACRDGKGDVSHPSGPVVADLTSEYCPLITCGSKRLGQQFQEVRRLFSQDVQALTSSTQTKEDEDGVIDLTDELPRRSSSSSSAAQRPAPPVPKTLSELRYHPYYTSASLLRADECLYPPAPPVGVVAGEGVHPRSLVRSLKTKRAWRGEGRVVRGLEEPVKTRKRKVSSSSSSSSSSSKQSMGAAEEEVGLYGEWQTDVLQIPPVSDGLIPRNQYGNWEVWAGEQRFVPRGAVYLQNPLTSKVCGALGIQCVPVVVGFESRAGAGGAVPTVRGALVLQEHWELVEAALLTMEGVKAEGDWDKKEKLHRERWERLARGVLRRQRLREEYGH